jgi:transcriptional regulator with XRE-family HTH domain
VRLGSELRKLREAAGLKGTEAASLLGVSSVQMSQIESGIAGVSEQRVRRLAANYVCADAALVDALASMATDRTRGWWEDYRKRLPASFLDLPELEHHATYRWDVEFLHIPGLLQTADYARGLFAFVNPEFGEDDVELWVEHRMRRRAVIERPDPVPYEAVIHEAALRIRVGDRRAARAQLTRVLELSEAHSVTVRIIPFDLDGFGGAGSAMAYAGGPVPSLATVVRDGPNGPVFIDAEAQLVRYRNLFHKVEGLSLDPAGSRDLIHKLTKES